jgi:hypothetical protein
VYMHEPHGNGGGCGLISCGRREARFCLITNLFNKTGMFQCSNSFPFIHVSAPRQGQSYIEDKLGSAPPYWHISSINKN